MPVEVARHSCDRDILVETAALKPDIISSVLED